jgi:hypothetical protein
LLVIADGPRPDRPDEAARCAATRAIIDTVDWPCQVLRLFSDVNMGVRARFRTAFPWVFKHVEEAIFLEHDTLPHPDFFSYCEQLLERYRDNDRVMWIGGTNPLLQRSGDASYFFSRINWVWGWATWKRAWSQYDIDVKALPAFKQEGLVERISPYRHVQDGFMALLDLAYEKAWDNWDIQASFTIWQQDGVGIVPNVNLVSNIGFGSEATNTTSTDDPMANLPVAALGAMQHPAAFFIDTEYDRRAYDAFMGFASDLAKSRRFGRVPFYLIARRSYRELRRRLSQLRSAA